MLVYHNKDFATDPTDRPILGWIVAETPQAMIGGKLMAVLIYKEGLNMVILDQAMGEQMIGVCHAADVANRVVDTVDRGFGFGDRVCKIVHQLESTVMVLVGPHNMVEHMAMADGRAHSDGRILRDVLSE